MHTRFAWMTTEELIRHHQHSKNEAIQEFIHRVELAEEKSIREEESNTSYKNKTIVSFIEEAAGVEFFDGLISLLTRTEGQLKPDMKITIKEALDLVYIQKQMVHNTIDCVLRDDY